MELTRRDVLAALAAIGAGCASPEDATGSPPEAETMVALAEVIYPSDVENVGEFVRDYSLARVEGRPDYRAGIENAVERLDDHSDTFHGGEFASLPAAERDTVLREIAVGEADPDPDGNRSERIRYYLVNELLFALYSTPTGGELLGTENPPGHPGGVQSYQGARR